MSRQGIEVVNLRNRRAANLAGLASIGLSIFTLWYTFNTEQVYLVQAGILFYAGLVVIPRLRPRATFGLLGEITLAGRILGRLVWLILAGIAVMWIFALN